jgi:hypothetical protein
MIVVGASTLGGFWTVSALTAGISALRKAPATSRPHQGVFPRRGVRRQDSETALLIPLAGPWISVGTRRHSPAAAVGLATLGIGQAVGLGMLIGGLSMSKEVCVPLRVPLPKERVLQMRATPVVSAGGVGLEIQGAF